MPEQPDDLIASASLELGGTDGHPLALVDACLVDSPTGLEVELWEGEGMLSVWYASDVLSWEPGHVVGVSDGRWLVLEAPDLRHLKAWLGDAVWDADRVPPEHGEGA